VRRHLDQSTAGSIERGWSGLRLALLGALATAFLLLLPAAAASAVDTVHVDIKGTGGGEVVPIPGSEEFLAGNPPIECEYPPQSGVCDTEGFVEEEEVILFGVKAVAAPGSTFVGWTVVPEKGTPAPNTCGTKEVCKVFAIFGFEEIEVEATFDLSGPVEFPLNLSTSGGSGTGTIECDTGTGPEACDPEYPEGKEVELIANPDEGSEFEAWSGDCIGSGACELTMDAAKSVTAAFDLESHSLTINEGGTGSGEVLCNSGSGPEECDPAYDHGTELTLIGEEDLGSTFAGFSNGTGSASSCTGTSPCSFTITEPSEVDADFEPIENP